MGWVRGYVIPNHTVMGWMQGKGYLPTHVIIGCQEGERASGADRSERWGNNLMAKRPE